MIGERDRIVRMSVPLRVSFAASAVLLVGGVSSIVVGGYRVEAWHNEKNAERDRVVRQASDMFADSPEQQRAFILAHSENRGRNNLDKIILEVGLLAEMAGAVVGGASLAKNQMENTDYSRYERKRA